MFEPIDGDLVDWCLHFLQWEEFLKLGDEIETSAVEEKIESQKPDQCAVLIYTVSYSS